MQLLQAAMGAGFFLLLILAVCIVIGIPVCMFIFYTVMNWILNRHETADTRKRTKAAILVASFFISVVIIGALFVLFVWYLDKNIDWSYN